MRLVKTFIERVTEKFTATRWELQPSIELTFEAQFNAWVRETNALVHNVVLHEDSDSGLMGDIRVRTFRYCALYSEVDPSPATVLTETSPETVPLDDGIPTVEVTIEEDGVRKPMRAMAGTCGVPKGYKLAVADSEPAPPPLFSPDLNLKKYAPVFRSKHADGR